MAGYPAKPDIRYNPILQLRFYVILAFLQPGILRDKTMDDELMYNPNYDKQYCTLKLLLKKFGHFYFEPTNPG